MNCKFTSLSIVKLYYNKTFIFSLFGIVVMKLWLRYFSYYSCFMMLFVVGWTTPLFADSNPFIEKSAYLLADKSLTLKSIDARKTFIPFDANNVHLNFGFSSAHLWIDLKLFNPSDKPQQVMLVLDNPLLETADLYCEGLPEQHQGLLQREYTHTLNPTFRLDFASHQHLKCLLHVHNIATTLQLGLSIQLLEQFKHHEQHREDIILFFLGMLLSLAILSLLMYLYARDPSYLLYLFYLATLVFQQVTYTGFLPSFAPLWFNKIDDAIVVPKIALMIVAAALYARAFLQTAVWEKLDRVYRFFIRFTLLQIPFVGTPLFYMPEVTVVTGLFFVIFNTYAGIAIYRKGYKAARFFVLAWLILAVGYFVMILDALGWLSVMYRFPMLIMALTVLEAILLLLAFVDRFYHYQLEKLAYEKRYNRLLTSQKEEVESEVAKRTAQLNNAVQEKETLFKELHHRVKNNLQLILSIVRLQRNRALHPETRDALQAFEQRIGTIANTHEMLLHEEGHELVEMKPYMQNLCSDLMDAFAKERIVYECSRDVKLPLREAVYVGLIVNELVTNIFKHATLDVETVVTIVLKQDENGYLLQVKVPSRSDIKAVNGSGLGMVIVKTLVEEQLGGTLKSDHNDKDTTTIRF